MSSLEIDDLSSKLDSEMQSIDTLPFPPISPEIGRWEATQWQTVSSPRFQPPQTMAALTSSPSRIGVGAAPPSTSWQRNILELKENELVTVNARAPQEKGLKVEKIPKEEAICRYCFNVFQQNMLETKCRCKFAMIHESCETEWWNKKGNKKCDVCEQDIEIIPITVSRDNLSTPPTGNNKLQGVSTRPKRSSYFCCFGT